MAGTKIDSVSEIGLSSIRYADTAAAQDTTLYQDQFVINNLESDDSSGESEVTYTPDWTKWNGYYRLIPEYHAIIEKIANWTFGDGHTATDTTKKILGRIRGWGKDDIDSIFENLLKVSLICGDSFAEIIRDKAGRIINLKVMNSGSMRIVVNKAGMLKRYEQVAQVKNKKVLIRFNSDDIFHLVWNRSGDEIHGIPMGEKLEDIMKSRNETVRDLKILFHRYITPISIIPVDTDDTAELASLVNKYKTAYQKTEPMFVPKDSFDLKNMKHFSLPDGATLDPLPYLQYLLRVFTTASGVPEVVMGWGGDVTEASGKVTFLGYGQDLKKIQRWFIANVKNQLGIEITLPQPVSIEPEGQGQSTVKEKSMSSDAKKDGNKNA